MYFEKSHFNLKVKEGQRLQMIRTITKLQINKF